MRRFSWGRRLGLVRGRKRQRLPLFHRLGLQVRRGRQRLPLPKGSVVSSCFSCLRRPWAANRSSTIGGIAITGLQPFQLATGVSSGTKLFMSQFASRHVMLGLVRVTKQGWRSAGGSSAIASSTNPARMASYVLLLRARTPMAVNICSQTSRDPAHTNRTVTRRKGHGPRSILRRRKHALWPPTRSHWGASCRTRGEGGDRRHAARNIRTISKCNLPTLKKQ